MAIIYSIIIIIIIYLILIIKLKAKGIGGGMPLAAVATRREIADKLSAKTHFNTYGNIY